MTTLSLSTLYESESEEEEELQIDRPPLFETETYMMEDKQSKTSFNGGQTLETKTRQPQDQQDVRDDHKLASSTQTDPDIQRCGVQNENNQGSSLDQVSSEAKSFDDTPNNQDISVQKNTSIHLPAVKEADVEADADDEQEDEESSDETSDDDSDDDDSDDEDDDDDDDDDDSEDSSEYYDSEDEEAFRKAQEEKEQEDLLFQYNLYSDAESNIYDYDYEDGTPAPKVVSPHRDSWDWTFKNTKISDLEVSFVATSAKRERTGDSDVKSVTKNSAGSRKKLRSQGASRQDADDVNSRKSSFGKDSLRGSFHRSSSWLRKWRAARAGYRYRNYIHYKAFERAVRETYRPTRHSKRVFTRAFDGAPVSTWADYERCLMNTDNVVYFEYGKSDPVKARLKFLFEDDRICRKTRADFSNLTFYPDTVEQEKQRKIERQQFLSRNFKKVDQRIDCVEARFITMTKKELPELKHKEKKGKEEDLLRNTLASERTWHSGISASRSSPEKGRSATQDKPRRSFSREVSFSNIVSRRSYYTIPDVKDIESRFGGPITWKKYKDMTAAEKFRHAIRMVILMLRAVGTKMERQESTHYSFLSWTIVYDEVLGISRLNYDQDGLSFDPQQYKANKATITDEVKSILKMSPSERSDAQIRAVIISFQHGLPSFSEFPLKTQKAMLKVCRFERFEPGRVLIRQGHRAENLYFIISGTAVVTEMDSGANHVHTANILGKGNSFGDLAFLSQSQRTATVTCRDAVELLCLDRSDFINIFMRHAHGKEPEHISYMRKLDILKGWPIDKLPMGAPNVCVATYVRRGVILCHDSSASDWIFIVMSGACRVLKALHTGSKKEEPVSPQGLLWPHGRSYSSVSSRTHISENDTDPFRRTMRTPRSSRHFIRDRTEDEMLLSRKDHESKLENIFQSKHTSQQEPAPKILPELSASGSSTLKPPTSFNPSVPQKQLPVHTHAPKRLKPVQAPKQRNLPKIKIQAPVNTPAHPQQHPPRGQNARKKRPSRPTKLTAVTSHPLRMTTPDRVFIEIARLEAGDVFGLDQVLLGEMRDLSSCSLVSSGAEVIMLNKDFFRKHLTEEMAKRIRQKIRPIPSERVLQKNLATHKTWEAFKASTMAGRFPTHKHTSRSRWLQT